MNILKFLQGKKTFIVCGLAIVWAIAGVALGQFSVDEAVNIGLAALAAAGLRDGLRSK